MLRGYCWWPDSLQCEQSWGWREGACVWHEGEKEGRREGGREGGREGRGGEGSGGEGREGGEEGKEGGREREIMRRQIDLSSS